jgi:DNA-binding GntR family transcriptional regulator
MPLVIFRIYPQYARREVDDVTEATPIRGKSQHAYAALKSRIMSLDLAPGQLLQESELIEELGLGRTPVREAIQRLAAEKLIVANPRQTAYVAPILAQELAEIVEMRLVLEVPAARMAAERGTAHERRLLEEACETFREYAAADDRPGILFGDGALHALVATMSRNSFLADYSKLLNAFSGRIWSLSVRNAHRDEAFPRCHDKLVRAICAGDAEVAGRAAADHVGFFRGRLSRLLDARPFEGGAGAWPLDLRDDLSGTAA